MGSPISPVLADIYMENFEKVAFRNYSQPPRIWWRYVDDTFVIMKKDHVQGFCDHINKISPKIKFTMELESEMGQLPFWTV